MLKPQSKTQMVSGSGVDANVQKYEMYGIKSGILSRYIYS